MQIVYLSSPFKIYHKWINKIMTMLNEWSSWKSTYSSIIVDCDSRMTSVVFNLHGESLGRCKSLLLDTKSSYFLCNIHITLTIKENEFLYLLMFLNVNKHWGDFSPNQWNNNWSVWYKSQEGKLDWLIFIYSCCVYLSKAVSAIDGFVGRHMCFNCSVK